MRLFKKLKRRIVKRVFLRQAVVKIDKVTSAFSLIIDYQVLNISLKQQRIQVRVFQRKPQTHRLSGKFVYVGAVLPTHCTFDCVAKNLVTVSQSKAIDRFAVGILNFDPDISSSRCREVDSQIAAFKYKWFGNQFTFVFGQASFIEIDNLPSRVIEMETMKST